MMDFSITIVNIIILLHIKATFVDGITLFDCLGFDNESAVFSVAGNSFSFIVSAVKSYLFHCDLYLFNEITLPNIVLLNILYF